MTVDAGEKDEDGNPVLAPKYTLHKLRHFYASWLIDQGFLPKRVQQLMGHSTITITLDIYGHLFPNLEADHEKLDAAALAIVG